MAVENENTAPVNSNFIRTLIEEDIEKGATVPRKWCGHPAPYSEQVKGVDDPARIRTRFPPEPNGYLHIGHAKSICINFGMARDFGGYAHMRFDDTNPGKESPEYVESIKETVKWLGFSWEHNGENDLFFASSYFKWMYQFAEYLIRTGYAYVDEQTQDEMRANRGTLTEPGKDSPFRNRSVEENLRVFREMRDGKHPEGSMVLRAKIDIASGNFNMRDPVIYRIRYMHHHRQGDKWCIYPMYDFAHPIQDALEGITHSLCSLEFEAHRPLYDWVVNNVSVPCHPRQIEFARLGIDHTVMSKRKLRKLVEEHFVSGWDDPRMPTLCGLRRRGFTSASIRNFCERIGVAKAANTVEYAFLEHCLREDLNDNAERVMAVLHPVKLVITNYPEGQSETFEVENNPVHPEQGSHTITFSREAWIEADDFMETPIPKYKRLTPNGPECRLKGAYLISCTGCKKDENGNVVEVYATYDPDSRGGDPADGRKVKGATIHWVDAKNCVEAEVREYDNLFSDAQPDAAEDFLTCLNPDSLHVLTGCKVEASLVAEAKKFDAVADRAGKNAPAFQFMRLGYFCLDNQDCHADHLVFNRSVGLKDSFKK